TDTSRAPHSFPTRRSSDLTPKGFDNGQGNAYINPLRDAKHGRIYRVSYKGEKEYKPVSMDRTSKRDLVNGLKSDNMFWRTTAQRDRKSTRLNSSHVKISYA